MPFVLVMILDYFNIPTFMGIKTDRINYNVFDAVINAFVVIGLYIITFILVDSRQIQKDHNAKMVAYVLLESSYNKCVENIELLENQELLEKLIIPKIDFNKTDRDNPVSMNLKDNPFSEYRSILDYSANGVLPCDDIKKYTSIMSAYKEYVSLRITFFDIDQSTDIRHKELKQSINKKKTRLINLLNNELGKLKEAFDENNMA